MPYAERTEVSPERSQQEIAGLVRKAGARRFVHGWDEGKGAVEFELRDRRVRFVIVLPTDARAYAKTPTGRDRARDAALAALEQEIRRRWRALGLVIKAKLEAVESGIVTFEQEFGMHIVLPDGSTVADQVIPAIARSYDSGEPFRPMLTALTAGGDS